MMVFRTACKVSLKMACILAVVLLVAMVPLILAGLYYISVAPDGSLFTDAFVVNNAYSMYSVVILSHQERLGTLRPIVCHYSYCPSVAEIVIVWSNKEQYADSKVHLEDFSSLAAPVRVRYEEENSLNSRFKPDPLLRTRAVLSIDDDILMRCSDIERAFSAWRRSPLALVGFHPRLLVQDPGGSVEYLPEKEAIRQGRFNMAVTSSAFLDASKYYSLFWSDKVAEARDLVNSKINCEDILMNFVVAWYHREHNISTDTVVNVRPRRRIDISRATKVGISRGSQHLMTRGWCAEEFSKLFGGFLMDTTVSDGRQEGGFVICLPVVGCVHL